MNGDTDYQKLMEIDFHGITYILTIKANSDSLLIELEDKYTGQIWQNVWEASFLEEITRKTGNYKKYQVFLKMLITAITKSSESVYVDVLTHHDIEMQNARRSTHKPTTDPAIAKRRYIILSYMVEFDKVHYPLALNFNEHVDSHRLKLTIKRLTEQLRENGTNPTQNSSATQLSMLKHQNQLLKARLRSKQQTKQNNQLQLNTKQLQQLQQLTSQLLNKDQELGALKQELAEEKAKSQQQQQIINRLQQELRSRNQSQQLYDQYETQINKITLEVKELTSELQHSRETDKKNKLKIINLQKQLQTLLFQKQHHTPKSSLKGSVSGKNIKKKQPILPRKRSSVFDSDTQSSRMRKLNNNRSSPFRQTSSAKKNNTSRTKYNNISNLNRNRSKSKSVKKEKSPPPSIISSSIVMTEELGSDSDEEHRNSQIMAQLRNRKPSKLMESKNRLKKRQKTSNALEDKISSIAEMLKKVTRNQ